MKKFNYNETYLNESFFDDIDDDIQDQYDDEFHDKVDDLMVSKQTLNEFTDKFNKCINDNFLNFNDIICEYDIHTHTLNIKIKKRSNNIFYQSCPISKIDIFNECLHILYQRIHVKTIFFDIDSDAEINISGGINTSEINFYNLKVLCSYKFRMYRVKPMNVNIEGVQVHLEKCDLNDNSLQILCDICTIAACTNILDYSFIKSVENELNIYMSKQEEMPVLCNFTGLPIGDYSLSLNYAEGYNTTVKYTKTNSLVGIPDTIEHLDIKARCMTNGENLLNHFSLEGLTEKLLDVIEFETFSNFNHETCVLVGPYIQNVRGSCFYFTKAMMKYVIKSGDYYIQCYKQGGEPVIPYDPSKARNQKAVLSAMKSITNANAKKQKKTNEANQIEQEMKNLFNKYCKVGDVFTAGQWRIKIVDVDNDTIVYEMDNFRTGENVGRLHKSWKLFFTWLAKRPYKFNRTDVELRTVVIDPVMKKREAEKNGETYAETIPDLTKQPLEVYITDMGNGKIGVYGKTYNIKEKIKALGGRFSDKIKVGNDMVKGWVVDKSKQPDIENIINN